MLRLAEAYVHTSSKYLLVFREYCDFVISMSDYTIATSPSLQIGSWTPEPHSDMSRLINCLRVHERKSEASHGSHRQSYDHSQRLSSLYLKPRRFRNADRSRLFSCRHFCYPRQLLQFFVLVEHVFLMSRDCLSRALERSQNRLDGDMLRSLCLPVVRLHHKSATVHILPASWNA